MGNTNQPPASSEWLKPGVRGPVELRTVKPGSIIEIVTGDFGVKLAGQDENGVCGVVWLATGITGTMPALASVMVHPAPGMEEQERT